MRIPMTPLLANLLCLGSMLVWAMGLPAAEYLIGPIPALPLTALRMSIAAAVLLPVWLLIEGPARLRTAPWRRGLLLGGLSFGLSGVLLVMAQAATDPVTVAVISSAMPVIGIAIECAADSRRLTLPLTLGLALSVAGGVVSLGGTLGAVDLGFGAFCAAASILAYTLGSRFSVTALPGLSAWGRTTVTLAGAGLATGIGAGIAALTGGPAVQWAAIGPTEIAALAVFSICGMALCQILWIASVSHLGIGLAALHMNAAPFYVMLFLSLLGQPWNWVQALGAAIVGAGVLIAQHRPTPTRQPT